MPKFTLAFWENRVREDVPDADRSYIKKTAKLAMRRHKDFIHEPTEAEMLEFYSNIVYRDPTPAEAIRNINEAAARRRKAGCGK